MPQQGFHLSLNELMQFKEGGIFSKVLIKSDTFNITLMCLSKGSNIDTHTSTKSGGVMVIKGKGMFDLEGKDIRLKPGVFIFMPASAPHSLRADEDLAILITLCA